MLYKLILAIIFLVTPQIVMALDTTQYRVASYISMIDSLNWSYNEKASHLAWAVQAYNISNYTLAEASGYSIDIVNSYIKYGATIKPIRFITDKEDKQLVMAWVNDELKAIQVAKIKEWKVGARLYIYFALVLKEIIKNSHAPQKEE